MNKGRRERNILKGLLAFYILCAFLLAGLNYGYAPGAPEKTRQAINTAWHIYENEVKTFLIIVCAFLTLREEGRNSRTGMRRKNLRGFLLVALAVHILGPRLLHNRDLYFFAMPLPWTTTALQLLDPTSPFHTARAPYLGAMGIRAAVLFFLAINLIVFTGTALLGRRWQCSTLCLFNGFAAEIWAPAFPLLGNRTPGRKILGLLVVLRYLLLGMALFYTLLWILRLGGVSFPEPVHRVLIEAEVWKYLLLELMLMMFFWTFISGRGYCHACPLGAVLSVLSRGAGQRITTDHSRCVDCGKCNATCPMQIDIRSAAREGKPLISSLCVGCGRCVDACPTETLKYSTRFLERRRG